VHQYGGAHVVQRRYAWLRATATTQLYAIDIPRDVDCGAGDNIHSRRFDAVP
jgi:hypothetical protein